MSAGAGPLRPGDWVAIGSLAAWFAATVLSQHPARAMDRVPQVARPLVRVPDWRFFAPLPGQTDPHVLVRVVAADGSATPWTEVLEIADRRWWHVVYDSGRRHGKGIGDVVAGIRSRLTAMEGPFEQFPEYQMLVSFARLRVRSLGLDIEDAVGFQLLLVSDGGFDTEAPVEIDLLSRVEPLHPE